MENKESPSRLSYILGEIPQNKDTINESENSEEPSDTNVRTSILTQENSVVSIPIALQQVIDLQNEQLGITDTELNRNSINIANKYDNPKPRKRRRTHSTSFAPSSPSKLALPSLDMMETRFVPENTTNNSHINQRSPPSDGMCNADNDGTNLEIGKSSVNSNDDTSHFSLNQGTINTITISDASRQENNQRLYHQGSGQFYTLTNDSVPSFHISTNVFDSPIEFFDRVSDLGQKYGCIKLAFIDDKLADNTPSITSTTLNFDDFSFKCRTQKLASNAEINKHALIFYYSLYEFYTNKATDKFDNNGLPLVNGKPFNLYALFRAVQSNGGFERVQKHNFWPIVTKEINFKKLNEEQLSVEQLYKKYLLDFEKSRYNTGKANISSDTKNEIKTVYELDGIGTDYSRIRDIKVAKHLRSSNNISSKSQFTSDQWQSWFPLYDDDKYTDASSINCKMKDYFSLSQHIFEELLNQYTDVFPTDFNHTRTVSLDQFERLYFDVLASKNIDLNIYGAANLSSTIHKITSSNSKITEKGLAKDLDRWNLAKVPLDCDSSLKFLNLDKGNYTSSKYSVGMTFSTSGWSVSDSFLPCVDYQHLGSAKVWYVVPPEDFEKFEEYLYKVSTDLQSDRNDSKLGEQISHDPFFDKSDLFYMYESSIKNILDDSNRLTTYKDFQLIDIEKSSASPLLLSNLQINPEILREQGIRVYRICQDAGSYVFQYPKCFTSTVGTDFHFSESAYFIPKSFSFEYLEFGSNWLASQNFLPGIDYYSFLINIVQYSKDNYLIERARRMLVPLVDKEMLERSQVFKCFPYLESISNKFDFISDYSLKNTGFSKVVVKYENTSMVLSLSEFLHYVKFSENNTSSLFGVSLKQIHVTVHLYYYNSFFPSLLSQRKNSMNSLDIGDPLLDMTLEEKVAMTLVERYDNERVPLNILEDLLRETKVYDDYYYVIRDLIEQSYSLLNRWKELWIELSVTINAVKPNLEAFEKNPLATLNEPQSSKVIAKLNDLVKDMSKSSVTFPELEYSLQLYRTYQEFKGVVANAVASNKLKLMEKAYLESFEIPLDHKHCQLLIHSICRFKWSDIYYELFVSFDVSEALIAKSLTFLYDFMNYGLIYCQKDDMPKLIKVRERLLLCQQIFKEMESIIISSKRGESVSIKNINYIVDQIDKERLPIPTNLKKTLLMISDCISATNAEQNPLITLMSGNKSYVEIMDDYIRSNSTESFNYISKFNGSVQDKRISIKDAKGKATLVDRVADYKAWHSDMRRITYNQSITAIFKSAKKTLDLLNDKYISPGIEQPSEDVRYCFCRAGEGKTMIECDICKEWYHVECVGGKGWTLNSNTDNSIFVCTICDINGNTVIHKPDTVNFGDLKRSVITTLYLDVIPDKRFLQQYFELFKIALVFRNSMFQALFKDGEIDKDVPISLVKYYLRKAEISKVEFIDLVGPLKRYCHTIDKQKFESFKEKKLSIMTV